MTNFISWDFTFWQWLGLCLSAICIGISKTGINGVTIIMLPILVNIFGAKESTGIVLPMLCFADLFAVIYYRRSAEWKYVIRLVPWAVAGFVLALFVDSLVPAKAFKTLIGICVLGGLLVMFWNELRPRLIQYFAARKGKGLPEDRPAAVQDLPKNDGQDAAVQPTAEPKSARSGLMRFLYQALFGIAGGFSTMIGNAAGPIMSVFLLSMRLPKASFVGTAAWFFIIVNYLKIPLQIFVWHNITAGGLKLDLVLAPVILLGAVLGILLVKKSSESVYRNLVYIMTLVSTVLLFL